MAELVKACLVFQRHGRAVCALFGWVGNGR